MIEWYLDVQEIKKHIIVFSVVRNMSNSYFLESSYIQLFYAHGYIRFFQLCATALQTKHKCQAPYSGVVGVGEPIQVNTCAGGFDSRSSFPSHGPGSPASILWMLWRIRTTKITPIAKMGRYIAAKIAVGVLMAKVATEIAGRKKNTKEKIPALAMNMKSKQA